MPSQRRPSSMRYRVRKFRAELFNACNQAQFNDPDSMWSVPNFGQATQARNARRSNFGLKLLW
jgi:hypothetical protein